MNWTRFAAVVIGTGVASSLTKWFFAGDWLHLRWDSTRKSGAPAKDGPIR
jgi:hypothetical protein